MDLYSTTQHNVYYDKYGLYVATVLNEPVIIGAVLPTYSKSVRDCFISYQQAHQVEIHEIIEQFIRTDKVCAIAVHIFNSFNCQISPPERPVVKSKGEEWSPFSASFLEWSACNGIGSSLQGVSHYFLVVFFMKTEDKQRRDHF